MNIVLKTVNDNGKSSNCIVSGINADIVDWLLNDGNVIFSKIFVENNVSIDELFLALGLRNSEDRRDECKNIIKKIWDGYGCFGPYELLDYLFTLETKGVFYSEYRDHVSHQLYVFLLGLYFYGNNRIIKNKLLDEINNEISDKEDAFLRRWFVASVYHDVGYIFENDILDLSKSDNDDKYEDVKNNIIKFIEELTSFPIAKINNFFGIDPLPREMYEQIRNNNEYKFDNKPIKDDDSLKDSCLFKYINDYAVKSGMELSSSSEDFVISRYYKFCHANDPVNRKRFLDHGITSSIILLWIWFGYVDQIKYFYEKIRDDDYCVPIKKKLVEISNKNWCILDRINDDIIAASSAISLHNINMKIWDDEKLIYKLSKKKIGYSKFKINLNRNEDKEGTPMAFLLAICDNLQMWDRPKFRNRKNSDRYTEFVDMDLSISPGGDKIKFCFINLNNYEHVVKKIELDLFNIINYSEFQEIVSFEKCENINPKLIDLNLSDLSMGDHTFSRYRDSYLSLPHDINLKRCLNDEVDCSSKYFSLLSISHVRRTYFNLLRLQLFIESLLEIKTNVKNIKIKDVRVPEISKTILINLKDKIEKLKFLFNATEWNLTFLGGEEKCNYFKDELKWQYSNYNPGIEDELSFKLMKFLNNKARGVPPEVIVEFSQAISDFSEDIKSYEYMHKLIRLNEVSFSIFISNSDSKYDEHVSKVLRINDDLYYIGLHTRRIVNSVRLLMDKYLAESSYEIFAELKNLDNKNVTDVGDILVNIYERLPHNKKEFSNIWTKINNI
nr:hypothetical protein [uncultured Desulfobulbus sp.]